MKSYVTITIIKVSTWSIYLTEIPEENHFRLSDYLNQIWSPLATLSALQRFGFPCTPVSNTTRLQELAGRLPILSPDAQNSKKH